MKAKVTLEKRKKNKWTKEDAHFYEMLRYFEREALCLYGEKGARECVKKMLRSKANES